MKKGEEWDLEKAKEEEKLQVDNENCYLLFFLLLKSYVQRLLTCVFLFYEAEQEALDDQERLLGKKAPVCNYQQKYQHLIGTVSAKAGAQTTQANASYGFGEHKLEGHVELM